jgi:hypothetical protein
MTTILDTSCSENTMVWSAKRGVSACMFFLVRLETTIFQFCVQIKNVKEKKNTKQATEYKTNSLIPSRAYISV